jgi:Flp pilus assembly protein TadD
MILAILLVAAGAGRSLQLAEATADRCLYSEALKILDETPPSELQTRAAQMFRVRLLVQLGRGKEAVSVMTKVLPGADPGEAEYRMLLGLAYSAANELLAAEKALREARQLGADKDLVDASIGMLRIQAGNLREAKTILRGVLKRDPLLTGALYNLACVHALRGNIAEAAALVRMSWTMGLKDPDQLRNDPMLASVRAKRGLIDDLMSSPVRHCGTY